MKNKEVRKDMALDANKGCGTCGILFLSKSVYQRGQRYLCRACMCAEEMVAQTPCGQRYCQLCGILIEPTKHKQKTADYCSACRLPPNTAGQQGDFSKTCQCRFCSNPYDMSSAAQKCVKMSIEPTPGNFTTEGSNSIKEKGPCEVLLREEMKRKQLSLKEKLVSQDSSTVKKMLQAITTKDGSGGKTFYIGGVDISFIKDNNVDACAALIIISFPDLEVVYKGLEMIQLTAPYIPGFLAFREVDSLLRLYEALLNDAPQYKPDVIFVDGNGRLHPRGFGLACHLGVLLDLPCVGVAKTLIHVDGIEDSAEHKAKKQTLKSSGDTFPLITNHGDTLGMALRSTCSSSNPVYVSVGHKISLQSAVTLVHHCCKYRIPEPTRFADLYSRQYLNEKCKPEAVVQEGEVWPN